jgi:hypothetical protein
MDTDAKLPEVLDELRKREPIFHRPEFGTTRAHFEAMTAEDFWEVGASGRVYTRQQVLDVLEQRYNNGAYTDDPWQTSDFSCRPLAENIFLLTYVLTQGTRKTRRATLWQCSPRGWKILYHQGTVIADSISPARS